MSEQAYARYLLPEERVVIAIHQHWAKLVGPIAAVVVGLAFAVWVDALVPPTFTLVADLLWLAWVVSVAFALWRLLEWRHDWLVATDRRLLLTYGLVTRRVAMMPLAKVTDLSYERSLAGRILGYGEFILESAGQEQALRDVPWIPDPDATYRAICAEIFGGYPGYAAYGDVEGGGPGTTSGYDDPLASFEREDEPVEHGEEPPALPSPIEDYSRAIPVPGSGGRRVESLYRSADLRRRGRVDDTRPVPRYPTEDL